VAKAAAINAAQAHPLTWKSLVKRAPVVAVAGAAIALALVAELASFTCNFALQRLALRTRGGFAVVTAGCPATRSPTACPAAQRDTIRAVLDRKWQQAVLLTAGRLGFDCGYLLTGLRATGADLRPSLVLPAYSAASIVALLPVTPGGLGIVEASLSGLLILADVRPGYAC
jgi:uncharacterized membrane protein YbhN (UPF0104 family)